jgi:hypothetical protein
VAVLSTRLRRAYIVRDRLVAVHSLFMGIVFFSVFGYGFVMMHAGGYHDHVRTRAGRRLIGGTHGWERSLDSENILRQASWRMTHHVVGRARIAWARLGFGDKGLLVRLGSNGNGICKLQGRVPLTRSVPCP